MKNAFIAALLLILPVWCLAQFSSTNTDKGLTIIVTDGTMGGQDSPLRPPSNLNYQDPIRPLGMQDAIQAGAFLTRPDYGRMGYLLVFCVGDKIGGQQGSLLVNGQIVRGVYRLIRQKLSVDEKIPEGMTTYRLKGTVYFLGIS